jgi:tetratricopeptide (TPR) repeat protein
MEIIATSPAKKWLLFLAALALAFAISVPSFRIWLADHWDASADPQLWQRAANLEPGNALYWEHLGRYREFDFEHSDSKLAIAFLKRAVDIDPGYDRLWMELAEAEESAGHFAAAKDDFEDARDAHPTSAEAHWRFGNYLVRQGDRNWGFAEIERAINVDPTLTPSAINVCWEASHSVPELLAITPDNSNEFYAAALEFFLSRREVTAAAQVWSRIASSGEYFDMRRAVPLVDALVQQGDGDAATKIWAEALKVSGWEHDTPSTNPDASLVFNGGFEHDIANGGLDWRETSAPGYAISMDANVVHSGKQSLRVTFDGNHELGPPVLVQSVLVKPNQKYEFSAYLRTESVTANSGVIFWINDPDHHGMAGYETQPISGTIEWTEVRGEITTTPGMWYVMISLGRDPSQTFDHKLGGTAWVDDVSLRPVGDATRARKP